MDWRSTFRSAEVLLVLVCATVYVPAQCCLGAQDVTSEDVTGSFRVVAKSLEGTGHGIHGPYRYEFRFERHVGDGEWQGLGSFRREFLNREHFAMELHVSPTGNGFLLETSIDPRIVFYGVDGAELVIHDAPPALAVGPRGGLRVDGGGKLDLIGRFVLREDVSGARWDTSRADVFLPLAAVVGPQQRREPPSWRWRTVEAHDARFATDAEQAEWLARMLHWSPGQGEREAETVEFQLRRVVEEVGEARQDAVTQLIDLGLSARAALRDLDTTLAAMEVGDVSSGAREALESLRALIERRVGGHEHPWRHLRLLAALRQHPDQGLAASSAARLARILPTDAPRERDEQRAWIHAHGAELRWDGERNRYLIGGDDSRRGG